MNDIDSVSVWNLSMDVTGAIWVSLTTPVVFSIECLLLWSAKDRLLFGSKEINYTLLHFLPFGCLLWTLGVSAAIVTLLKTSSSHGGFSVGSHAWLNVGWERSSLNFFGIQVNSAWSYFLVINYQIARCILGSLLSNIFKPYILGLQGGSKLVFDRNQEYWLLSSQAAVTVFSSFSYITDIFLFLSQVDMSVVSLAVTMFIDWHSTSAVIKSRRGLLALQPLTETVFAQKDLKKEVSV